ncbi:MAG: type II secretion system protein GspG [Novipirellula sp. JB048]
MDSAYEIISYGADHQEGGSGAAEDIRSTDLTRKKQP